MTSPKSIWNHEADKDLLLAIISEGTLKSISWANIATKMEAKNYTFTQEACRYVLPSWSFMRDFVLGIS